MLNKRNKNNILCANNFSNSGQFPSRTSFFRMGERSPYARPVGIRTWNSQNSEDCHKSSIIKRVNFDRSPTERNWNDDIFEMMNINYEKSNIIYFALIFTPIQLRLFLVEELKLYFLPLLLEFILLLHLAYWLFIIYRTLFFLLLQFLLVFEVEVILEQLITRRRLALHRGDDLKFIVAVRSLVGAFADFLEGWVWDSADVD